LDVFYTGTGSKFSLSTLISTLILGIFGLLFLEGMKQFKLFFLLIAFMFLFFVINEKSDLRTQAQSGRD
jgi:hypothetical protein